MPIIRSQDFMNQSYSWRTLYPIHPTAPPLTVKVIFDEHSYNTYSLPGGHGVAFQTYPTTHGERSLVFDNLISYFLAFEVGHTQPTPKPPGQVEVGHTQSIPKPAGQAGALSRGGYCLEEQLNWQPGVYSAVQVCCYFSHEMRGSDDRLVFYSKSPKTLPR